MHYVYAVTMRPSRDRVASRLDFTRRGLANQSNQSRAGFLNRYTVPVLFVSMIDITPTP